MLTSNSNQQMYNRATQMRVLIAEDFELLRTGLAQLLSLHSERFKLVGQVDNGYKAINYSEELRPDILILDLHMPGDYDGFEVIKEIRERRLPIKILVLTVDTYSKETVVRDYGADVCLIKNVSNEIILSTMETLFNSPVRSYAKSATASTIATTIQTEISTTQPQNKPLSPRELDVLILCAKGLSRDQIGQQLKITSGTVGVNLVSIYKKFSVKNRAEAVSFAYRNKIIPIDQSSKDALY